MSMKKSAGNMYPWVTHTHCHLGGECPHKCAYCYVKSFPFRPEKYRGPLRLIEKELAVDYGTGKTIFIENCNDMFSRDVPGDWIWAILQHCRKFPDNIYVFQSKNPRKMAYHAKDLPPSGLFGTTIESCWAYPQISDAPMPLSRQRGMRMLPPSFRKFVTIEPILDFNVDILSMWIDQIRPEFVNIGADSKRHNLPEPTPDKVHALIAKLKEYGIEIREKHNLERLLG